MKSPLKRLAARLPRALQQELKRFYFRSQIVRGKFRLYSASEPEYLMLDRFVSEGDWVLDIGANIGHFTLRLSELVGISGRVVAFEPVTDTFELLASNVAMSKLRNITLVNAAASDGSGCVGMSMPRFDTGLDNYYMAHIDTAGPEFEVLAVSVDSLRLENPISLAKIDAEGHELSVLKGMSQLLSESRPTLIVENNSQDVGEYLSEFGYVAEQITGSSNLIFRHASRVGED